MNAIDPTTAESRTERESWVEEIEAECFRGISRALRLSLGTQPGGPTSLLLIGDNGTGKSSVVDALQFALQGEIRGFTGRRAYPIARSGVSDASPPRVAAVLSSGDRFERSFAVDAAGQPQVVGDSAAVAFSRTPLVLRRTDILRFWDTDAAQRQLLLARYFKAEDVPAIDAPWRAPAEIEPPASTRSSLIAEALEGVEARVTGAFARISPQSPVRSVVISLPEPAGLDIKIELASGQLSDPALVLSEANRDVLALLTFVAVAQAAAERGQAKVLVLDDVFQSSDAPIRVAAMNHLLEELTGWQFVLTAHDRLWREQLVALFRRHGRAFRSYEIVGWSLTDGPTLRDASALTDRLATVLESGDPTLIAACAGLALEQLCDTLSWTLPVSIIRKSDDKYTLGDLWPAIYKRLKKTELKPVADEIDLRSPLRNLVGAHYNEWAQGVSLEEARWFGTRVVALARAVNCIDCGQFVKRTSDGVYECKCRRTSFRTADSAARG